MKESGAAGYFSTQNKQREVPSFLYISLFFLIVCINALVAKFATFSFGMVPGVSSLYIVAALMVAFGLWYGMYGVLAAYVGCIIGAGILNGIPPDICLYWSLSDFWQVIIPLVAFRMFDCDPAIKTRKDLAVLLVFGVILNNIVGAVWGSVTLALGNEILWSEVSDVFAGWLVGNIFICIILLPLLLHILTPYLQSQELYVRHGWH